MKKARIYAFGDSFTYGDWDRQGGWCDRLRKQLHGITIDSSFEVKYQMFNLGISGDTSRSLRKRMDGEIRVRYCTDRTPVILINIGVNDTTDKKRVPIEEYRENIEAIIKIAREYTDNILIIGLPPVRDNNIYSISNISLKEYNQVLLEIAKKQELLCVNVMDLFKLEQTDIFCEDNAHFNDRGHELLSEAVWGELENLLS